MLPATRHEMSDNLRGAAVAVATLGAFSCNDAIVKVVMMKLPEPQAVFLRGMLVVPLLSVVSASRGEICTPLEPRDRRLVAARCAMDVANTFAFLAAIHRGPMADVAVVLGVQPLERVRLRRRRRLERRCGRLGLCGGGCPRPWLEQAVREQAARRERPWRWRGAGPRGRPQR